MPPRCSLSFARFLSPSLPLFDVCLDTETEGERKSWANCLCVGDTFATLPCHNMTMSYMMPCYIKSLMMIISVLEMSRFKSCVVHNHTKPTLYLLYFKGMWNFKMDITIRTERFVYVYKTCHLPYFAWHFPWQQQTNRGFVFLAYRFTLVAHNFTTNVRDTHTHTLGVINKQHHFGSLAFCGFDFAFLPDHQHLCSSSSQTHIHTV